MLTNGTIITNSAVISVIGTLAVVGSTFILEAVFWFLQKLLATKRPSDAFKISIGAETGFAFQLGTSLWVSYRRLTPGTRNSPSLPTTLTKFNGINTITCVSVICVVLIFAVELGIIYASQSVTTTRTLEDGGMHIFTVGRGRPVRPGDWRGDTLEIGHYEFSEAVTSRYFVAAEVILDMSFGPTIRVLEEASKTPGSAIRVRTLYLPDTFTMDGRKTRGKWQRQEMMNEVRIFLSTENRMLMRTYLQRTLETLNTGNEKLFSDFSERQAHELRKEVFNHIGFRCNHTETYVDEKWISDGFICFLQKRYGDKGIAEQELIGAMSQARRKLQAKIFEVSQYMVEHKIGLEEEVQLSGQKCHGTVSVLRGIETNKGGFFLLSISACLGLIRILSAAFVDYGNISEKHQCKEHFATHHVRADKSEGITIIKTVGVEEMKALEHSQSFRKFDQIRCSTR